MRYISVGKPLEEELLSFSSALLKNIKLKNTTEYDSQNKLMLNIRMPEVIFLTVTREM
jgi:hypothetical protein